LIQTDKNCPSASHTACILYPYLLFRLQKNAWLPVTSLKQTSQKASWCKSASHRYLQHNCQIQLDSCFWIWQQFVKRRIWRKSMYFRSWLIGGWKERLEKKGGKVSRRLSYHDCWHWMAGDNVFSLLRIFNPLFWRVHRRNFSEKTFYETYGKKNVLRNVFLKCIFGKNR
jgi:hypothetical protein